MGFDMQVLKDWVAAEDARRRAAFEAGEARVEWAVPGYRVGFGEVCEKARELGWRGSVVDLRLGLGEMP